MRVFRRRQGDRSDVAVPGAGGGDSVGTTGAGEPLDIGDRVVAAGDLGGFPRVRRGTPGVIIGCTFDGLLTVRFVTGRTYRAGPDELSPATSPARRDLDDLVRRDEQKA